MTGPRILGPQADGDRNLGWSPPIACRPLLPGLCTSCVHVDLPLRSHQILSLGLKVGGGGRGGGAPQLEGGSERRGNSSSEEPSGPSLPLRITRTWLTWPGKRAQPGPCGRGAYLYWRGPCRKPFLLAGETSPGADLTRNADAPSPYTSLGWAVGPPHLGLLPPSSRLLPSVPAPCSPPATPST